MVGEAGDVTEGQELGAGQKGEEKEGAKRHVGEMRRGEGMKQVGDKLVGCVEPVHDGEEANGDAGDWSGREGEMMDDIAEMTLAQTRCSPEDVERGRVGGDEAVDEESKGGAVVEVVGCWAAKGGEGTAKQGCFVGHGRETVGKTRRR